MLLKKLFVTARPRFWIYLFGPFLIGLSATISHPQITHMILPICIFGIYLLFPANLMLYGINDIYDYETDRLNKKKQSYESLVTPNDRKKLWFAIALTNIPFLIYFFIVARLISIPLLLFLCLSIFYSAPPIRAKTKPILDAWFNGLYIFPGIIIWYLVTNTTPPLPVILASWGWAMAMHAFSAIPDIAADKAAHLNTIATFFGAKKTLLFCTFLYGSSAVLLYSTIGIWSLGLGLIYLGLMGMAYKRITETTTLFRLYTFFPLINTGVGFVLFLITLSLVY